MALRGNETETFSGFPAAGIQFLDELKQNNDRDWFRERKEIYDQQVKRPMELLVVEASAICRQKGLTVYPKDKNPVMRIYRDIRFSADKRPFNTRVGASLRSGKASAGHGEIYIHVSPEESFLAAGFWMPERPFLQLWRDSIVKNPAAFLKVTKGLAKGKLKLSEEGRLTRLPRGFDQYAGSEITDFLRLTSYVTVQNLTGKDCRSARLVALVSDFALAAKPLLEYGWNLGYAPQRDILDER